MTLLAQRWERIQAYKRHGKDGAPVTGKLYEVAAAYLLECPEAIHWIVHDEPVEEKKLANYIKNSLDMGKKYARQELYTSGAEPVVAKKTYDWWDIAVVKQMFKTSEQNKQEYRQTDFCEDDGDSILEVDLPEEVPQIAMSVSTDNVAAAQEQAVGAEVLGQRRTSLGKTVSELKSATLPLLSALSSRLSAAGAAVESERDRVARAFSWAYKHDQSESGLKLCAIILQGNKLSKSVVAALNALQDMNESPVMALDFVHKYVCHEL